MAFNRSQFGMLRLPGGNVLAAGGLNGSALGLQSSAEIFDAKTKTWSTTGSMNYPRAFVQMVFLIMFFALSVEHHRCL